MSDNPIIWAMTKAHYEAMIQLPPGVRSLDPRWDALDKVVKDQLYDAMWTALKELRVPSQEMVEASWKLTSRASAAVRMKMELAQPREAHKLKMAERFTAMIDNLLEIK